MELTGRRALVTGAGARLGQAIALGLAGAGCDVAVHFHRSAEGARATASGVERLGRHCTLLPADLADASACSSLVGEARRRLGGLDILVNSAATFPAGGLVSTSVESWDAQLDVDLRAPFLLAQALAAEPPAGPGAILNLVDARSRRPAGDHFAYRIAKAGLEHMTLMLARELAPGFRVNAVALGAMLPAPGADAEDLRRLAAARVPLGHPGGAEEVVTAALYLLRSDFVTGAVLTVDGGEYL